VGVLGQGSQNLLVAVVLVWRAATRVVRGVPLPLPERPFVEAVRPAAGGR